MPNRRTMFTILTGGLAAFLGWRWFRDDSVMAEQAQSFEIEKPAGEWKRLLTAEQYSVLREHGTERAGTSPLNTEKRKGIYACAACDLPLYSSGAKYESGTGWPSFYEPLANAIATSTDRSLLATRTEVHCRRCGGHLGHVFDDGPKPTGMRYCMNGIAMKFTPDASVTG
jgi:peptide-methionine (R)-S-oxide reductase